MSVASGKLFMKTKATATNADQVSGIENSFRCEQRTT